MIPRDYITEWRAQAPWVFDLQVEQDLVISRALVAIFSHPLLSKSLALRGGTALYKLYIKPPARYSEDIDLVQINAEPVGPLMGAMRDVLDPWLGKPRWKQSAARVTFVYRFGSEDRPPLQLRLKVEINSREHFAVYGFTQTPFKVSSRWFLGACAIGCFCWAPRGFAGNETSDCLLRSATRGHRPAGGRRMPVDGPADRADWGRIALLHAAASPCIRFMFSARHTRAHSPCAWFKPRTLKRRKPSACLIQPLGASDSHLRLAYCA